MKYAKAPKGPVPTKASILVAKRGMPVANGKEATLLLPVALVTVHYGTYRQRRSWKRQAHHFGCAFRVVQGFAEGGATCERDDCITAVLEVWGAPEAMESLMNSELVLRWEYRVGVARDNPTSLGREKNAKGGKPKPKPKGDGGIFREVDAARKAASETWEQWLSRNGMAGVKID